MEKIMAVNAGSSSLKFQLLEMPSEVVLSEGVVEKIGSDEALYTIKYNGEKHKLVLPMENHSVAVEKVLQDLVQRNIVQSLDEITGVGHRVVQGGWLFQDSAIIDDEVLAKIDELSSIAPLHNPANIIGIKAFQKVLPNIVNVAVFDTSFHQTMKEDAYMYALPYEWYEHLKIRRYGFHGTSHKFVSQICAKVMNKNIEDLKIISCHLGNGASIAAINGGICADTSMGFTPLEGIPMGTRSGTIDSAILEYIAEKEELSIFELSVILNRKSGYLGVSGLSNDSRELENAAEAGHHRSQLALDIQYKRIADYIGSYYVYMGGLDAIIFTAGIGENSNIMRREVLERVKVLGVEVNHEVNNRVRGEIAEISTPDSKVKAFLIPTNEELMIARDVVRLMK